MRNIKWLACFKQVNDSRVVYINPRHVATVLEVWGLSDATEVTLNNGYRYKLAHSISYVTEELMRH